MSDITANIVVEPINLNIQAQQNEITITPEAIGLNVYLGGLAVLGGNVGELQFNNAGSLGGVTNTNFSAGNLSLGDVSNVKIGGGVNTYYLQTDGTGNLSWGVGAGNVTGNGTPGGSVNQIQYNLDGANFGGSAGFTFDPSSNAFATPGAAGVGGNLTVLQSANIVGNIIANNFVGTYANGTTFIDIPSANGNINIDIGGTSNVLIITNAGLIANDANIGNVTSANIIGNINTAAQPNITSVGTLTNLSVSGTTSIYEGIENVTLAGLPVGTYNFDMLDGSIQYTTANAISNLVLNFRGNSSVTANTMLPNAKSITSTYLMTTGTTPYGVTGIQIDGANANISWASNVVPLINSNTIQSYTFTIIKTSTTPTYTVLGSLTRYG